MESTLQICKANLEKFINNPESGIKWKERSKYGVTDTNCISAEQRIKLVKSFKRNIEDHCGSDFPPVFYEAHQILNTKKWIHSQFFQNANTGGIFSKFTPTDALNANFNSLVESPTIKKQLEHCGVDVDNIPMEWHSMKSIMSRWSVTSFPPSSLVEIGKLILDDTHSNLFILIDYLLCHGVSSAEAERGFSIMKEIKGSKRAIFKNRYLCNQMLIKIDGPTVDQFDYDEAITHWFFQSRATSKNCYVNAHRSMKGTKSVKSLAHQFQRKKNVEINIES